MRVAIGSDHAGFEVKGFLKGGLLKMGFDVVDVGVDSPDRSDYSDFAHKVSNLISGKKVDFGVLICGSGIGMCMAANRHKGVRAAVLHSLDEAKLSRQHNDANVACFGARLNKAEDITEMLDLFLNTKFEGGRHQARVEKIEV